MSEEVEIRNLFLKPINGQIVFSLVNNVVCVIVSLRRMKAPLNMVTFPVEKLEVNLDWLCNNAFYNSQTQVQITGKSVSNELKLLIQEKLNVIYPLKSVAFEESTIKGLHHIFAHSEFDSFLHDVEYKPCLQKSPLKGFDMMIRRRRKSFNESRDKQQQEVGSKFPILVCCTDFDLIKLIRINENGESKIVWTSQSFPGNSLLGLAKIMIGVKTLEELDKLAILGEKHKLDLHLSDVVPLNKENVFMNSSLDMALFAFGRISEFNLERESCKNEDLARSLMQIMTDSLCHEIFMIGVYEGIPMIYMSGKLAGMKSFQDECEDFLAFWSGDVIRFRYLESTQISVLGAFTGID